MGWGRWLLLGDIGQQLDLEEQRADADTLRRRLIATHHGARTAAKQIKQLQDDVDELKVYLATALRLLAAKGVVTPDELKGIVSSVDKKDPPRNKPPRKRTDRRQTRADARA